MSDTKGNDKPNQKKTEGVKLEWKDYVAIGIAALQTTLLPVVLLLLAVVVISILFRFVIFR
jgi:hypothetical protein